MVENIIWLLFSTYYRYARQENIRDTALTENERSCQQMLITTELQQSVQSIALLSGNWKYLSVFCQQLPYFFYSYAFFRLSYIYNAINFKLKFFFLLHLSNFILNQITFFGSFLMAQGIWGCRSLNTFYCITNADLWRVISSTLVIIFTLISRDKRSFRYRSF